MFKIYNAGHWYHRTLPAGFMEIGESAAEGATRETLEEACAEVEVLSPFAQLDIPLIAQVSGITSVLPQQSVFDSALICVFLDVTCSTELHNFPSKSEEAPLFAWP